MSTFPVLTGELLEAFAGTYLSGRYDDPCPTPSFHRECWELYTSSVVNAGVVAPRDHAKSTALTFDFCIACVCWRVADYVIIIGSTEDKAQEQLINISEELHVNEDLKRDFFISTFEVDQKTELVVCCRDGHRFRIIARGAEQKIRGALWNGKRPNLIIGDDMEDDEQVESRSRREKFSRWFFRAAKQSLSKSGRIRVHGTILHEDSLLSHLKKNKAWSFLSYKAHKSYGDFTEILWPERWSEEQLRQRQFEMEQAGDSAGYSQEYLNDPMDNSNSYLLPEQFSPLQPEDFEREVLTYVGCDFAVSKKDSANRTSFTVGGRPEGSDLFILDQKVGVWDTLEWIIQMLLIEQEWQPQVWFVEGGVIWKSIQPILYQEMLDESRSASVRKAVGDGDLLLNIEVLNPVKDKGVRGRSLQKRMKARTVFFDTEAEWFAGYRDELLRFTGGTQSRLDDQFDSTATLCMGLDKMSLVEDTDFDQPDPVEMEEWEYQHQRGDGGGRSSVTGY